MVMVMVMVNDERLESGRPEWILHISKWYTLNGATVASRTVDADSECLHNNNL
jgi:hypothetical protein